MKKIRGLHLYSVSLLKKLYHWVLKWAYTPYGSIALFILAFVEASFFIIPPDVLLITLALGRPRRWFRFVLIATVGSVLGGLFGYYLGYAFFQTIGEKIIEMLHYQDAFAKVGNLYAENAFMALLGAAFTPIPYKVFTIAAGFWKVPISSLVWASVLGRGARFFIIALMIRLVGPKMKEFIEKYFNWLSLAVFVLMILGFVAVKYLL